MSDWKCPPDRFPIMGVTGRMAAPGERKLTVPLAVVVAHERQAQRNHGQTVQRLKERGGLAWCELAAVLEDRDWRRMDQDEAHEAAMRIVLGSQP